MKREATQQPHRTAGPEPAVWLSRLPVRERRDDWADVSGRHSQTNADGWDGLQNTMYTSQLCFQHHSSHVTGTQAGRDRGPIAWELYFPVPYCPRRPTLQDLQPALWEAEHRLLTSHHR